MRLWSFFIFLIVTFLAAGVAFAQGSEETAIITVVAIMKRDLKLNDGQVRQIKNVLQEQVRQAKAIRADGFSRDSIRREMADLAKETESKFANYLTSEQLERWQNRNAASSSRVQGDPVYRRKRSVSREREALPDNDGILVSGQSSTKSTSIQPTASASPAAPAR